MQRGKIGAIAKNYVLVNLWKLPHTRTTNGRPYNFNLERECKIDNCHCYWSRHRNND